MNEFKKGVAYGIALSISVCCIIKTAPILYRQFTGEISPEYKAKAIYDTMEKYYTGDIDKDKMYEGIYAGMVYSVADQYSGYITAEGYESFLTNTNGNYCGIGILTGFEAENDSMVVLAVFDDSPAKELDIQIGDIIKKVEDLSVTQSNYSDAISMIKGEEGTKVNVTFYRPSTNTTKTLELTRKNIDYPTVGTNIINDNIGYMRITNFDVVTVDQFKEAVENLKNQNISSLIIDLRNNPGGLLNTATNLIDTFLSEGVITYTENKNGEKNYIYATEGGWDIPMAILVNDQSASASELFTGALKDSGLAKIVGTKTYGKGVVQTTFPFKDGSALKLTTAKYYTPSGVCIDGVGIEPDIVVEADSDFTLPVITGDNCDYDLGKDKQLSAAVEALS